MKLGLNAADLNRFRIAAEKGFDYVDVPLKFIIKEGNDYIDEMEKLLKDLHLTADSFNAFFDNDVQLIGEGADKAMIRKIAEENIKIAARFGADNVVIGSAKARRIPEGYTKQDAMEAFGEVLDFCGNLCGREGIKIAVEPLREKETNFINTVLDGYEMCEYVGNPHVGCLVDFFHFFSNGGDLSSMVVVKDKLIHAHLARPNIDRCHPQEEDLPMLHQYAAKLKEIGYKGRLTLECNWKPDFESNIDEAWSVFSLFKEV